LFLAPSAPRNITVSFINATAVNLVWDKPAMPSGIIRSYTITILTTFNDPVATFSHTDISALTAAIYGLTHNTSYIVNISAVTVEQGDVASMSFTTPSCKCVIVLICYVMYCFY